MVVRIRYQERERERGVDVGDLIACLRFLQIEEKELGVYGNLLWEERDRVGQSS